MTTPREDIMKRLEALLNLKTSRGATQAEMETAMAMAQRLAFKHRIDLDEVIANPQGEYKYGQDMVRRTIRTLSPMAHQLICVLLHRYFGVNIVLASSDSEVHIVGMPVDVDFAIYVYAFLRVTFYKLWFIYKQELIDTEVKPEIGKKAEMSFYTGLSTGLNKKLGQSKVDMEHELAKNNNSGALVLVDDHKAALIKKTDEEFPDVHKVNIKKTTADVKAWAAGNEAASGLNINKAIGGGGGIQDYD